MFGGKMRDKKLSDGGLCDVWHNHRGTPTERQHVTVMATYDVTVECFLDN